jgi:hypothetical protein
MSPKELNELAAAVEDLSKWLTDKLKGNTQYGAYSMSVLGEEAVTYFTERAVMTFFKGNWKRKKNETLRELLGRMVISDMGHAQRDYKNKGEVMIRSMDDDHARLEAVEQATLEWEEGLERLELAREVAYDIAAGRRVAARTLVVATPAETLEEMTVMMIMMMSLTIRPLGQWAAVQGIARQPFFCSFFLVLFGDVELITYFCQPKRMITSDD